MSVYDIGFDKGIWIGYWMIYMVFSGKIDEGIDLVVV